MYRRRIGSAAQMAIASGLMRDRVFVALNSLDQAPIQAARAQVRQLFGDDHVPAHHGESLLRRRILELLHAAPAATMTTRNAITPA